MIRLGDATGGRPIAAEVSDRENADPKQRPPTDGTQTPRQDLVPYSTPGLPFANGNNVLNPCGFPGYGSLYGGSFAVYRFMTRHPRIAHARRKVFGKILSNAWGWVIKEGCPEAVADYCRDTLTRLRRPFLTHALRALDYGHVTFEKVWRSDRGRYVIDYLKPLSVDTTQLAEEAGGRFAGVYADATDNKLLNRRQSILVTYDGEAGDLYGNSRLENIRETAWRDWLDCATQLMYLSYKISGKLAIILAPAGEFVAPDGYTKIKWRDQAIAAGKALSDPRSNNVVYFPTMSIPDNRSKENIDLAKIPVVQIDVKDFGDSSPAVAGFLARLAWNEDLMFAGYHLSSRSGMQGQHGTNAEAETQTEDDTTDPQLVESLFAEEVFGEQVIDDAVALNFDPKWKEYCRAIPASLRDKYREGDWKYIGGILEDPEMRQQFYDQTDAHAVIERQGIPINTGNKKKRLKLDFSTKANEADGTPEDQQQQGGGDNGGAAKPKTGGAGQSE